MKNVNEVFTDDEFKKLKLKKGEQSWHDFIMQLAEEEVKK
jgi:predicted CopG family antitoxin